VQVVDLHVKEEGGAFRKRSLEQSGLVDAVIFGNELNLLTTKWKG
jgi:hypothetical protein